MINIDTKTPKFIENDTLNHKSRKSGNRDIMTVISVALRMSHPDAVALLKVQHDHVGTSLVRSAIFPYRSDLWHAVQYYVNYEILPLVLYSADVEHIRSSNRDGKDTSMKIVSIANIGYDSIENQNPAIPGWDWCCCSSCKRYHLSLAVLIIYK